MDVILSGPDNKVEYVEVVDPFTLEKITELNGECVIAAAMHCGDVRLIDNMRLGYLAQQPLDQSACKR